MYVAFPLFPSPPFVLDVRLIASMFVIVVVLFLLCFPKCCSSFLTFRHCAYFLVRVALHVVASLFVLLVTLFRFCCVFSYADCLFVRVCCFLVYFRV